MSFQPSWRRFGLLLLLALPSCIWVLVCNPIWTQPRENPTTAVDPHVLETHVRQLSDNADFRNHSNLHRLEEAATYIENQLRVYGYEPQRQAVQADGQRYDNIVLRIGQSKRPLVVLGAHYDVCYETPGADDNASGVAALLEIARLLRGRQEELSHPIELVFYTLEEPPHFRTKNMGSSVHAGALREQGQEVALMVAIEMIGRFSNAPNSQSYPFPLMNLWYPSQGNFLLMVGRFEDWAVTRRAKHLVQASLSLPLYSINAPRQLPGIDFSDHRSYWDQGYPAIMITDTAFYRNYDYHTMQDTADRLNYRHMADITQAVAEFALQPAQ